MSKKKKHNKYKDVLSAMRCANREIELARNGGRWVAKNRPHKNKKKYDRKNQKINSSDFFITCRNLLAR
jgi:hypothetical protein